MSAELIVLAESIRTLDPTHPFAEGVAISGGRVVGLGTRSEVLVERGRRTEVVTVPGAAIVPGLVDGHTHPVLGVDMTAGADLVTCGSPAEVRAALAAETAATPSDEWVRAWGLDPNAFNDQPLHRRLLDDVVGGRPALVLLFDGHAALASTAALQRAGITGSVNLVARGQVVCDEAGHPTGHLLEEEAIQLVLAVIAPMSFSQRRTRLRQVLQRMAATGLTGGHVMDLADADVELYRDLDEAGDLPLRLRIAPWCRPGDTNERIDELIAAQRQHGRVWAVAGVKLFIDGTIDGGTAWLSYPDRNGESVASYWDNPEQYTRVVHRLAAADVATATHAIGDAGVRHVLDTIASAPSRTSSPHRVEHIETLPDDQLPRFVATGAIASMQPTHATEYTFADLSDNWSRRLGPERAAQGWRCGDLIRAGATVVFGSDWPVAHYDPRGILAAAQTRRPVGHPDRPAVGADQAVTAAQALTAYTRSPAIAAADHAGGRITLGARADLTVFAADPIDVPADELTTLPVRLTVMDGVIRHRGDDR